MERDAEGPGFRAEACKTVKQRYFCTQALRIQVMNLQYFRQKKQIYWKEKAPRYPADPRDT